MQIFSIFQKVSSKNSSTFAAEIENVAISQSQCFTIKISQQ